MKLLIAKKVAGAWTMAAIVHAVNNELVATTVRQVVNLTDHFAALNWFTQELAAVDMDYTVAAEDYRVVKFN